MLVAVAPAQPAVPLEQLAIVRKVDARSAGMGGGPSARAPHARSRHSHPHPHHHHHHHHAHHRRPRHPHAHPSISYRLAGASWYGGGGSLACGGTLTSSTLGVANKTLPCGTHVRLRYHGREVRVRVIDRGPYVAGREFDLTEATKRALGFGDTGEVWWSLG
jgi:rare lipoprotein A (peptidoglycan hydrolase)